MKRTALVLLPLVLAGCGQQNSTTTTTTANSETGAVVTANSTTTTTTDTPLTASALGMQPGKWETTIAVTDMEMNGVHRSAPAGTGQKVTTCVTPDMAAKGYDQALRQAGFECATNTVTYADGRITGQRTCKTPMGMMSSVMTGTYSPTAISADAEATVDGRMKIKEKIHTEARRVGDCG